jgi:hypothetical protein
MTRRRIVACCRSPAQVSTIFYLLPFGRSKSCSFDTVAGFILYKSAKILSVWL